MTEHLTNTWARGGIIRLAGALAVCRKRGPHRLSSEIEGPLDEIVPQLAGYREV